MGTKDDESHGPNTAFEMRPTINQSIIIKTTNQGDKDSRVGSVTYRDNEIL